MFFHTCLLFENICSYILDRVYFILGTCMFLSLFFINFFLTSDKLLIESTKSGDYEILKKGAERADGINDVEEFKITEVSVLL